MSEAIQPIRTTDDMIRVVPDTRAIPDFVADASPVMLNTMSAPEPITIHAASQRTRLLLERIYGTLAPVPKSVDIEGTPALLMREGDHQSAFRVDPYRGRALISGSFVTVARLKVAIRFLAAYSGLNSSATLVPIHGCVVSRRAANVLITGNSGVGKSWIARSLAGRIVVDDWCLYDSTSGRCLQNDESPVLLRGDNPDAHLPPWTLIEEYDGDPLSPLSRYLRGSASLAPPTTDNAPISITHMLIVVEPFQSVVTMHEPLRVGEMMRNMIPRFGDEALDLLSVKDADATLKRLDLFARHVRVRQVAGLRRSDTDYQHGLTLIRKWVDENA